MGWGAIILRLRILRALQSYYECLLNIISRLYLTNSMFVRKSDLFCILIPNKFVEVNMSRRRKKRAPEGMFLSLEPKSHT